MAIEIDWDSTAAALRPEFPDREPSGGDAARRTLEMILGEEAVRQSVDYYVAQRPARELVRSVLWLLRPWSAMTRCRELAQGQNKIGTRQNAVELLRVVADHRALPWVPDFLNDADPHIQDWGIGLLDHLLWSGLVSPEDAEDALGAAEHHENPAVREHVAFIRGYLRDRRDHERPDGASA